MNDADIIVALGDTAGLAEALGVRTNSISNWKTRGIPWPVRAVVRDLARRKRVKLPDDFLTNKRVPEEKQA